MELLLVRHARAEDRDVFAETGHSDDLRPLTDEGRRRMRAIARGLKQVFPRPVRVVSSPLFRAVQTAEIIAESLGGELARERRLSPEYTALEVITWLDGLASRDRLVLVGHEPNLGECLTTMLCGMPTGNAPFKKGGAACVCFPGEIGPGMAQLSGFWGPSVLRALAKG